MNIESIIRRVTGAAKNAVVWGAAYIGTFYEGKAAVGDQPALLDSCLARGGVEPPVGAAPRG